MQKKTVEITEFSVHFQFSIFNCQLPRAFVAKKLSSRRDIQEIVLCPAHCL